MRATFRPLRKELWQGEFTKSRKSAWSFRAPWSDTLAMLDRELTQLGAKELVIEADFRESDIRLDGMPRSNARVPQFPGIRIAFESKHGPLVYQTDAYSGWRENVRAIALGLQALRAVDRYGITSRAEQYTGFKAIGSGSFELREFSSSEEAITWLRTKSGIAGAEGASLKTLSRMVARLCHPDHGGSRADWDRYSQAYEILRKDGLL